MELVPLNNTMKKIQVLGEGSKILGEVDTIQEFMRGSWGYRLAKAVDADGYYYFNDGTGLGFRGCVVLYSDLDRVPFHHNQGVYQQGGKISFGCILRNARDIKDLLGLKESLKYLDRLRVLMGR